MSHHTAHASACSSREAELEEQLAQAAQDAEEAEAMAQEAMTLLEAAQVLLLDCSP